jgi:hypothetical protein
MAIAVMIICRLKEVINPKQERKCMGKLAKRISVGALLLVFATMAFGQTEILVNGDLEAWTDANTPTGWHKLESITQDADSVHGGTYSAKHVGGTSDFGQYVPVTGGYTYEISVWYKNVAGDGSDSRIWSYWRSAGTNLTDNADELRGPNGGYFDNNSGEWTEYTVTLQAPETADTLYFELRTYSGATTYFDDISIVETAPPAEDPLDYFIPKGSHQKGWATLEEAVDSINANGVVGEINLILDADTLRENSFTFNADLDADNNVTVKPAEGRDVVLIVSGGASQGNGDQMIGFDKGFVTFDGSNDGTDSRNLIVTTEMTSVEVPFGLNTPNADNVTIKNLIIKNLDNGVSDFKYGVVTNDIGGIDAFTVQNCQIGSPDHPVYRDGVAVWGDWTNLYVEGIVTDNDIHTGARGISTYIFGDCVFNNNNITMYPSATSYGYNYGVYLSWGTGAEVKNNVIVSAEETPVGTSVARIGGVVTASHPDGAAFDVENNMVSVGVAAETVPVFGFLHMSASDARNFKVYHNTFVVNENAGTSACYGVGQSSTGPITMDLKNNIIINNHTGSTSSEAVSLVNTTTTLTSDRNDLVCSQGFATLGSNTYADLAAWQAAGQDVNSISKAVTFTGATDLHLAAPSDTDLDLVVAAIPSVDTDIDGDARGTFYAYVGADEGTAYPASNDLTLTFDDATDVANWSHYDEANAWTAEAVSDSMLVLSDAGYSMVAKRPVSATIGSVYKLTIDIKTSLWEGASNVLELSVQGLGADQVTYSCINDTDWVTYTIVGVAEAEDGYIRIGGAKAGTVDTVFVDNVVWDDQYMDIIASDDIASVKANYSYPDYVAVKGVVTATTIGAPIWMQDATAGIALYDWDFINDGIVEEGDEILVVGQRTAYKGLEQIQKTDENYVVLSKGNPVVPTLITVPDLESRDYQGMLVVIEDVDTVDGFNWPNEGQYMNNTLTDKDGNEFIMFIDNDSEIDGATPPESWPLDLVGVVNEYNVPEITPRYMADFLTNRAPNPFMILNPADSAVFSSLDDAGIESVPMNGDTVKALFVNWTDADDPEGDSLVYEMVFIGDGPDETITSVDTFMYIPLDQEEPYGMNGTYTYYFTATDPMGEMAMSDTHTITFDFPAPPMIVDAQVVLVDGTPAYYAEFDLPLASAATTNFMVIDTDEGTETAPTAVEMIGTNAVLLTVDLVEDHNTNLATSGLMADGATVTVADTSWGHRVIVPFSDAHPEDAALVLEDFETNTGAFQTLTYSGSTGGILTTSTFDVSDEEAYEGSKSGKMNILDDPASDGGWFVRIPYDYPSYNTEVKANSIIMFLIKGTAADVQITMTIKDTGYERAMWKNITLSSTDWQVVAFDLANDPCEGWITGNGEVTGTTVKIADVHIQSSADEDAVLYIDGFTERQMLEPVDITLSVMMHEWLRRGDFNLATDFVDVAGTFNGWDGSSTVASDFDGDTTYSVTVPLMPYTTEYFKFRINGSWNDATAEFPYGAPARELVVPAAATEFFYWYNNDTLQTAIDGIPKEFALHQNYPNPFNPTTTINFDLPEAADVKLVIYDITGRKVRTLVNDMSVAAGYKKIVWNGRDDFGNGVSTGMYIYRLTAGDFVDVKKMTFLK